MRKTVLLLTVIVLFISLILFIIKGNIQNNVSGRLLNFSIKNFSSPDVPIIDIYIYFEIINNSFFNLNIDNLKLEVYDSNTDVKIAESREKYKVEFPKGISTNELVLENVEILSNINLVLEQTPFYVIVKFSFLFSKIEFKQQIN